MYGFFVRGQGLQGTIRTGEGTSSTSGESTPPTDRSAKMVGLKRKRATEETLADSVPPPSAKDTEDYIALDFDEKRSKKRKKGSRNDDESNEFDEDGGREKKKLKKAKKEEKKTKKEEEKANKKKAKDEKRRRKEQSAREKENNKNAGRGGSENIEVTLNTPAKTQGVNGKSASTLEVTAQNEDGAAETQPSEAPRKSSLPMTKKEYMALSYEEADKLDKKTRKALKYGERKKKSEKPKKPKPPKQGLDPKEKAERRVARLERRAVAREGRKKRRAIRAEEKQKKHAAAERVRKEKAKEAAAVVIGEGKIDPKLADTMTPSKVVRYVRRAMLKKCSVEEYLVYEKERKEERKVKKAAKLAAKNRRKMAKISRNN